MARLSTHRLEMLGQLVLITNHDFGKAQHPVVEWSEEIGERIWMASMATARKFSIPECEQSSFASTAREKIYRRIVARRFRYWSGIDKAIERTALDYIKHLGTKKNAPKVELSAIEETVSFEHETGPSEVMLDLAMRSPFAVCIATLREQKWPWDVIAPAFRLTESECRKLYKEECEALQSGE